MNFRIFRRRRGVRLNNVQSWRLKYNSRMKKLNYELKEIRRYVAVVKNFSNDQWRKLAGAELGTLSLSDIFKRSSKQFKRRAMDMEKLLNLDGNVPVTSRVVRRDEKKMTARIAHYQRLFGIDIPALGQVENTSNVVPDQIQSNGAQVVQNLSDVDMDQNQLDDENGQILSDVDLDQYQTGSNHSSVDVDQLYQNQSDENQEEQISSYMNQNNSLNEQQHASNIEHLNPILPEEEEENENIFDMHQI